MSQALADILEIRGFHGSRSVEIHQISSEAFLCSASFCSPENPAVSTVHWKQPQTDGRVTLQKNVTFYITLLLIANPSCPWLLHLHLYF